MLMQTTYKPVVHILIYKEILYQRKVKFQDKIFAHGKGQEEFPY